MQIQSKPLQMFLRKSPFCAWGPLYWRRIFICSRHWPRTNKILILKMHIQWNLYKAELELGGNLLNVNKFYSPGQKNQCYLFCITRKFVQCGKYFRSHAVPPYTSFTVICPTLSPLVRHIYGQTNSIPQTAVPYSGKLKIFKSVKISRSISSCP
jgi:hypothetical protein